MKETFMIIVECESNLFQTKQTLVSTDPQTRPHKTKLEYSSGSCKKKTDQIMRLLFNK